MPMEALQLRRGDVFHHVSAGGGGSGSPFERDPALVLEDVLDEKVSVEAARERYGVVIEDGERRPRAVSFDLVIRGGTVYDGTGAEGRVADVGVEDGRIAAIGAARAERRASSTRPASPSRPASSTSTATPTTRCSSTRAPSSAIHQGVTTEVVGNCGFGCFPIRDPQQARRAIYGYSDDLPLTWSSAGEYFEQLEAAGPAVNVLSLVPNGQLRLATLGLADRPADAAELAEMQVLLRESLDHGAWGYSTGLEYAQEQAASEEELTALARNAPFYATHTRRRDDGAADAVAEAIRTGANAEVRLQVSHLVPRNGIEESRRCIELVEAARDGGQDVAFDMHTRTFGLTNLYAALPAWALGAPAGRARGDPARSGEARRDAAAPLDPERRERLVARRAARQRDLARVQPPRPRVDRRRPRPGAARRRLRPPARRRRRAAQADGDHPRVLRGPAARGVRAQALRARLRRDHARPRRPARGVVLPRRLHVGVLVLALHGPRRAAARRPRTPSTG